MTSRPHDPVEALRNTRRSLGDGTLGGRSRIATPFSASQLRRAVRASSSSSSLPVGELLALTGTSTTGTTVLSGLDSIQSQVGFDAVTAASDTVALPTSGSWLAEIDVRFTDGYRGGGTVEVTLGGTAISASWPTSGPWSRWVDQAAFAGERGDVVELSVVADDAGSHPVEVTFRLTLVERLRGAATSTPVALTFVGSHGASGTSGVDTPAATEVGDLVLLFYSQHSLGSAPSPDAGWTTVYDDAVGGGSYVGCQARIATSAGVTSYSTAGVVNTNVYLLMVFRGVGLPSNDLAGSVGSLTSPSLTGATVGDTVLSVLHAWNGTTTSTADAACDGDVLYAYTGAGETVHVGYDTAAAATTSTYTFTGVDGSNYRPHALILPAAGS